MTACIVCGGASGKPGPGPDQLCQPCGWLLDWFRGYYSGVDWVDLETFTCQTTFLELSIDSLDYVEWLFEVEKRFGVAVDLEAAERMREVGDLLRYIRTKTEKTINLRPPQPSQALHPLWDVEIDGS
jgi:acyl carrier protein